MINETERVPEVLREHFDECLRHFASRFHTKYPPGRKGLPEKRRPIGDFCGVGDSTVQGWLSDQYALPVGAAEIKLKCFLDLNGYRIIEFERLPKILRNISELIGYSVLTADEVHSITSCSAKKGHVYEILREKRPISKSRLTGMFELWKERKDELEQKKKEALKLYRIDLSGQVLLVRPAQLLLSAPPSPMAVGKDGVQRSAVLTILEGTLAFFTDGLFEELSENEVVSLKEYHGSAIVQLTSHLSALSSKMFGAAKGD